MPENPDGIPFLSSIGFSITARCPIACAHCIVEAGPRRKEEMAIDDVRGWIEQAGKYREGHIKSIVITGGEPFYNLGLLAETLNSAVFWGLVPVVITNAFWASSVPVATSILQALPQIRMLTVSTDVYHQKSIPIQNAKNALTAAKELGLGYNAAVCFDSKCNDHGTKRELSEVVEPQFIFSAAISPAGRASRFGADYFETSSQRPTSACTVADYPTIFPDGRLICCMGIVKDLPPSHPLNLGNLRDRPLHELLDAAERNAALHILRVWGPGRLLEMLDNIGLGDRLPRNYTKDGCCDLCYALAADPELGDILVKITRTDALVEKLEYARLFYLNERAPC